MNSPIPERWRKLLPAVLRDRFCGSPIRVRVLPSLTNHRGKLLSASGRGTPVHAAAFLRERRLVLESSLQGNRFELIRILTHELFHFAWVRLGNGRRGAFEQAILHEWEQQVKGELGWSAENAKAKLAAADCERRSRRWRDYLSESFCDTAAWVFARRATHNEYTLAARWRNRRELVFLQLFSRGAISI